MLRERGYKITQPRKQLLQVLGETDRPLSPYDLQRLLQEQGRHVDHVTIYRVLELFCSLNLVHKVLSLGGFVRCTLGDREGCHSYMICRDCGVLQEFADKALCEKEDEVAESLGFHPDHHLTELLGVCSNCHRQGYGWVM